MKKFKKASGFILLAIVMSVTLSGCGVHTPSDMVAVQVGGGPLESKKVKGCVPAASRKWWTNDSYYYFPTSEREWDATGQSGSDSKPFTSVTADSVIMNMPVTIRFTLKTDCPTLEDFYVKYARRYGAKFDSDGTYNDAWETLLRKLVADPADQTLDRIVQSYPWKKVWNDPQTKTEIEQRMNEALQSSQSLMIQTAKASYFDGISVLIGTPSPQNPELAAAVASAQTKVAEAQAQQAQAKADKLKAEAETKVAKAEAAKQRAEIAGFDGIENYLRYQCILQGCNPYQPTYVVGGTAPRPQATPSP